MQDFVFVFSKRRILAEPRMSRLPDPPRSASPAQGGPRQDPPRRDRQKSLKIFLPLAAKSRYHCAWKMAYFSTEPASERRNVTEKNRVWDFFPLSNETHPSNRRQPLQPRRKIRPTATKPVSGIPYWPSRDPIGENGGENLYGFVGNDGIDRWDLRGLDFLFELRHDLPSKTYKDYFQCHSYTGPFRPWDRFDLAKPAVVDATDDVVIETLDGMCARIVRAKQVDVNILVILASEPENTFTDRGVTETNLHELRRALVYRKAYNDFIASVSTEQSGATGELVTQCGWIRGKNKGEAAMALRVYLIRNRDIGIKKFNEFVKREQEEIGGEVWVKKGIRNRLDSIPIPYRMPVNKMGAEWEPCPHSGE